ncbi:MAG: phage holin family protein [Candidatus Binatia bacterium]
MERIEISDRTDHKKSIGQLVTGILQDAQTLITKELAAAKLEVKHEVSKGVKAGVSLGIGGFMLALGFVFLSLMLVFLLTTYTTVPLWGSLGIVGLVYCIVGGIFVVIGKRKVSEVKTIPESALQKTKEDVRYIADRASSSRH